MNDLSMLPRGDWIRVRYESLLDKPGDALQALCDFADIPYGPRMQQIVTEGFAISRYTLTTPDEEKWKRHETEICEAAPIYSAIERKIANF